MDLRRKRMVEEQIEARGVSDEKVIAAMLKVKRHLFVPEESRQLAYQDYPLSLGHGQTISQPYIVAYMTELLNVEKGKKVLEVGTGSGYQAAVLAEIVQEVYTIEIVENLAVSAGKKLKELGYKNVFVKHGDGFKGWPEHAPYDVIMVTAAPAEIPEKLIKQLKVGGRMVIPIGSFYQDLYLITRTRTGFEKERMLSVRFVPMIKGNE